MNRDMRDMRYDGRNPYGSRGGYVSSRRPRGRRGDRGMDYGYDMRDMRRGGRRDYADMRMDRGYSPDMEMGRPMSDMRGEYNRGYDGHYGRGGMQSYEPIEFMGYCNGYYGAPQDRGDYGRGRDYGYDMRRDYGDYGYRDYGYRDYGDYGETLSKEELEKWQKKLMKELNDKEKQMFSKQAIIPKFSQMGIEMKDFGEEELYTMTLAMYTDHKNTIGQNPDLAIKLARDFMVDEDSNVKGAERVAVYYDTFVED